MTYKPSFGNPLFSSLDHQAMLGKLECTRAAPSRPEVWAGTLLALSIVFGMVSIRVLAKTPKVERPMDRYIVEMPAETLWLFAGNQSTFGIRLFVIL